MGLRPGIELKNGRSYFHDTWQLPAKFKNLQGKDIYWQFTDLQGTVRAWRGDYRATVAKDMVAPPAFDLSFCIHSISNWTKKNEFCHLERSRRRSRKIW